MCIIIYKPKNLIIEPDLLINAWDSNPHGAGFTYWDESLHGWVTLKGLMTFDDFFEAYSPFQESEMVLHFRIATHGVINEKNTHPFQDEEEDPIFFHNGVLGNFGSATSSDSAEFYHLVLKHLPNHLARVKLLQSMTRYGKFALLEPNGAVSLIGEFIDLEGLQASNLSFYFFDESLSEEGVSNCEEALMVLDKEEWEEEQATLQAQIARELAIESGEI